MNMTYVLNLRPFSSSWVPDLAVDRVDETVDQVDQAVDQVDQVDQAVDRLSLESTTSRQKESHTSNRNDQNLPDKKQTQV